MINRPDIVATLAAWLARGPGTFGGAELEIFSQAAEQWLPRVQLIIVETHDRLRPGGELAVRKAVALMFGELPRCGENLFFRRVSN
jgi:hypothetical protein